MSKKIMKAEQILTNLTNSTAAIHVTDVELKLTQSSV